VNALMNFRVPQNAGKLPGGCTIFGLSSGNQLHRVISSVANFQITLCYNLGGYSPVSRHGLPVSSLAKVMWDL
jgi:hypothetical protein